MPIQYDALERLGLGVGERDSGLIAAARAVDERYVVVYLQVREHGVGGPRDAAARGIGHELESARP